MTRPSRLRRASVAVLALLACAAAPASALTPAEAKALADTAFAAHRPELRALYEDIHSHPELGFQETRTAAKLAAAARAAGFEVTEGVGRTGVVAVLRNGPGPVVMVRTELDALPLLERTGLPYASHAVAMRDGRETPVAHACGHDIHMAMWVGVAQTLAAARNRWRGTLVFVAQPAEEVLGGARAMLADGLYTRFPKPDVAYALHVGPGSWDRVVLKTGVTTSASDNLTITFKGRGGHGATPNAAIDPVVIASRFVGDVQTLVSREKDPAAFGVVTVGSFQAGAAGNVIPDEAVLKLTLRSYAPEVRRLLRTGVERIARAAAAAAGAPEPLVVDDHATGPVVNDDPLAARTGAAFTAAFGDHASLQPSWFKPGAASEDFAYFIEAGVPASFFSIGGYSPARVEAADRSGAYLPSNHNPAFAPEPEPSIRVAMEAMTVAVLSALAARQP